MGIFQSMLKGTYSYVAENIATLYYAISINTSCTSWSNDQRLFASGIIDSTSYLNNGSISLSDVRDAILLSHTGNCSLSFYTENHTRLFECDDSAILTGFIMQMECLFFNVDSKLNYHDIVDSVVNKKDTIDKAAKKVMSDGRNSSLFRSIFPLVGANVNDISFKAHIESFSL